MLGANAIFGKRAGDVRYTKAAQGAPNTVLRNLYEMRDIARQMWEREVEASREGRRTKQEEKRE